MGHVHTSGYKKLTETQGTLVLVDEAGFSPTPPMPNTWAMKGTTPRMKFNLDREKLSAIGGITPSGELYFEVHDGSVGSDEVALVQYLEQLLRQMDDHVVILRDGLPQHRSAVVKDFVREHGDRLTIFRLPPYCPDFNQVELSVAPGGHEVEQDEGILPEQSAGAEDEAEDEAEQRGRGAQEEARCPGVLLRGQLAASDRR
jgi:hypothetical protein